jgi:signal recognition particle subunit SRP54
MGEAHAGINFNTQPPAIILMAGLQGAGKTTTVGKLGKFLKENHKKKVLVVSCDVYRPAAIEQLKSVAGQAGVDFFPSTRRKAGSHCAGCGRLGQAALPRRAAGRYRRSSGGRRRNDEGNQAPACGDQPDRNAVRGRCHAGSGCVNTAKAFNEALPLTGVVLTKLDGDARGGAALSVRHVTGKPIKFAGVGEKLTGLEAFHPERMASRILGMGDVLSLIEEAPRREWTKKRPLPSPRS